MCKRNQHSVGTSARGRDECGTLADTENEMVNMRVVRVCRRHPAVAKDVHVHEQTIKEPSIRRSVIDWYLRALPSASERILASRGNYVVVMALTVVHR
jgi:hypothetical protein